MKIYLPIIVTDQALGLGDTQVLPICTRVKCSPKLPELELVPFAYTLFRIGYSLPSTVSSEVGDGSQVYMGEGKGTKRGV